MNMAWLPKVDKLIMAAAPYCGAVRQVWLREAAREIVDQLRQGQGDYASREAMFQEAVAATVRRYQEKLIPSLRQVINATGIVLHTNLGRSPLADEAIAAIVSTAGYCNLELELSTGERSSRYYHVLPLLKELTGAEDCLVVNNNAAAVLLVLDTFAKDKSAIVSRGQLVEIGGGFRVPDIMKKSGVALVEVGTTNKTYLTDYQQAISADTALLMWVHTSNFRIVGFTQQPPLAELTKLAHEYDLPVMADLGSGCLYDLSQDGIGDEPVIRDIISNGVDILTCSGDKLLGGPQAGIILGKQEYIQKLKSNPLTRALRVDKFTLAALEATLRIYKEGREKEDIPALAMIGSSEQVLESRARSLQAALAELDPSQCTITAAPALSEIGGGSLPGVTLPTWTLQIKPLKQKLAHIVSELAQGVPAVLGYVREDKIVFDMRTVREDQIQVLAGLIADRFSEN